MVVRVRWSKLQQSQRRPATKNPTTHLGTAPITKMRLALATRHMITPRALIHARLTARTRPGESIKPLLVRLLFLPLIDHPRQLFPPVPPFKRRAFCGARGEGHVFLEEGRGCREGTGGCPVPCLCTVSAEGELASGALTESVVWWFCGFLWALGAVRWRGVCGRWGESEDAGGFFRVWGAVRWGWWHGRLAMWKRADGVCRIYKEVPVSEAPTASTRTYQSPPVSSPSTKRTASPTPPPQHPARTLAPTHPAPPDPWYIPTRDTQRPRPRPPESPGPNRHAGIPCRIRRSGRRVSRCMRGLFSSRSIFRRRRRWRGR